MKKKVILIIVLALIALFTVMVSKDISKNPIKKKSAEDGITQIFDAPKYARISTSELTNILGEPKSTENWSNETSKGTFEMTIYSYDLEDAYAEFIVYEDNVVKIRWFSSEPIEISDKFDNVFKMFNITVGENAKKLVDTGVTYKFSPVSENVAEFDVYNFDSNKHTFDTIYITYNLNYFD